jgi:hypothetical protein
MCRAIRPLFNFEPPATDEEIRAAALQYVRKVSGSTKPSASNHEAFDRAVDEITAITRRLVHADLITIALPRTREQEALRAKARGQARDEQTRRRLLGEPAKEP